MKTRLWAIILFVLIINTICVNVVEAVEQNEHNQEIIKTFDEFLKKYDTTVSNNIHSTFYSNAKFSDEELAKQINNTSGFSAKVENNLITIKEGTQKRNWDETKCQDCGQKALILLNLLIAEKQKLPDIDNFKRFCGEQLNKPMSHPKPVSTHPTEKQQLTCQNNQEKKDGQCVCKENFEDKGEGKGCVPKPAPSRFQALSLTCLAFCSIFMLLSGITGFVLSRIFTRKTLKKISKENRNLQKEITELKSQAPPVVEVNEPIDHRKTENHDDKSEAEKEKIEFTPIPSEQVSTPTILYAYLQGKGDNLIALDEPKDDSIFQIEINYDNPEQGTLKLLSQLDNETQKTMISFYANYQGLWSYNTPPEIDKHSHIEVVGFGQVYKDESGYWKIYNGKKMQVVFS